jgi:hypothetical protein
MQCSYGTREIYTVPFRRPQGKRLLGDLGVDGEKFKIDSKEKGCPTQDRDQWPALLIAVPKLWVPQNQSFSSLAERV